MKNKQKKSIELCFWTVESVICFTKRSANVILELFSSLVQSMKSVEVLGRTKFCLCEGFVPCGDH